jgi:hypothetical protein
MAIWILEKPVHGMITTSQPRISMNPRYGCNTKKKGQGAFDPLTFDCHD